MLRQPHGSKGLAAVEIEADRGDLACSDRPNGARGVVHEHVVPGGSRCHTHEYDYLVTRVDELVDIESVTGPGCEPFSLRQPSQGSGIGVSVFSLRLRRIQKTQKPPAVAPNVVQTAESGFARIRAERRNPAVAGLLADAGGGTRTPDTRIMIPLL